MAGIPPLGGFTSKFILFSSAIGTGVNKHLGWLIWLTIFAVINSAISLYYYVRVIRRMYVDGDDHAAQPIHLDGGIKTAIGICMVFVILVGVYPAWFVDISMEAARDLLAGVAP
jgi:NADH:ubiquinone oxidoreductase subunit 2 (subunit N)